MTTLTNTAPAPRMSGFAGIMENFRLMRARRREYNRTFMELSRLSERELNDIGLTRGDVRRVALEAADMV